MGVDKSLARPGRKQANASVRMARISFGALPCRKKKLMRAHVSMLLKSRASLTCLRACFLPGWSKDLSAPRYVGPVISLWNWEILETPSYLSFNSHTYTHSLIHSHTNTHSHSPTLTHTLSHSHTHTQSHTVSHTHTFSRTHTHTHKQKPTHTLTHNKHPHTQHAHTNIHSHKHTLILTQTHTHTNTNTHSYKHTLTQTHSHKRILTQTHTHINTLTQTHTHTPVSTVMIRSWFVSYVKIVLKLELSVFGRRYSSLESNWPYI